MREESLCNRSQRRSQQAYVQKAKMVFTEGQLTHLSVNSPDVTVLSILLSSVVTRMIVVFTNMDVSNYCLTPAHI